MEIIYLRGSPWTASLLWCIGYSGNFEKVSRWSEHTPLFGELRLRWKARTLFPSQTLTVPMLVNAKGRMENCSALETAKMLCEGPVFPAEKAEEIAIWYEKASAVARYGRNVSFTIGENLLERMAPEAPFFIGQMVARWMKRKYEQKDMESQRVVAIKNLKEVQALVDSEKLVFLLGTKGPTFADLAWAILLEFLTPEFDIALSKFLPKTNAKVESLLAPQSFEKEFTALFRWKRRLIKTYFVDDENVNKVKPLLALPQGKVEETEEKAKAPDEREEVTAK